MVPHEAESHGVATDDDKEDGVSEWVIGLPTAEDLTPLSQCLVPPELASAFGIKTEPQRTYHDVERAAATALSNISALSVELADRSREPVVEGADGFDRTDPEQSGRKLVSLNGEESMETNYSGEDPAKTSKRPRLVWSPQLHKRFVDVVAYLGINNAVPKTIMQLMNVEGLTRENVASHLQKYRLYLKRMQGVSMEGTSSSSAHSFSYPAPPPSEGGGGLGASAPVGAVVPLPVLDGGAANLACNMFQQKPVERRPFCHVSRSP